MRTRPVARRLTAAATTAVLFTALALVVLLRHRRPIGPDAAVHRWFLTHRAAGLTTVLRALTNSAPTTAYVIVVAAAMLAGARLTARTRWRAGLALAAVAAATMAGGQFVRFLLVQAIGRPRPPVADWASTAGGSAFPSGHATTAALAAGIVWVLLARAGVRRWYRAAAALVVLWAAVIGLTRVYLGVHWPTDVLGGWLLAATCVLAVSLILRPAGPVRGRASGQDHRSRHAPPR